MNDIPSTRNTPPRTNERGSVLIVSLVLIAVMTILGLSLFDLAQIENRLAISSVADARAFEAAQAGIQRGLRELLDAMVVDAVGAESLANGTPACTPACSTTAFNPIISSAAMPNGGTFTVSLKLMTIAEANGSPYGQTCLPHAATTTCANLVLLRSEGVVDGNLAGGPPGYTGRDVIQVLARAEVANAFGGGITTGAPSGNAMNGNVKIAGSIHILGDPGLAAFQFNSNASGMRNNWADLDSTSLARITPLQLVCPPGRTCSGPGDMVESLGATLKVAKPIITPAVILGPSDLGKSGDSASYGVPARKGKGPLDGIFVADGCVMPCTDNFTGASVNTNVFVDGSNITKPYPGTPPAFPLIEDPVRIGGTSYNHYACVHGSSCFGAAGAQEFFRNHAADLTAAFTANLLATGGRLRDDTALFTIPVAWTDKTGTARVGQICWSRILPINPLYVPPRVPPANTLEFGSPTCEEPTSPQNPMLIYLNRDLHVDRQGGPIPYNYRGAAVVVATGRVKIEETFQTSGELLSTFGGACPGAPVNCLRKFPEHDMLAILTTDNMEIGKDRSNIDHVMGLFHAGCIAPLPCSASPAKGRFFSQKQTNIVGTVTAWEFGFAGGCGDPGGNVPSFFQVPQDPRSLPEELFLGSSARWSIAQLPRFWLRCRPGATATSPATVTGVCSY